MSERLFQLARRIRAECDELARVLDRMQEGWRRMQRTADDHYLDGGRGGGAACACPRPGAGRRAGGDGGTRRRAGPGKVRLLARMPRWGELLFNLGAGGVKLCQLHWN